MQSDAQLVVRVRSGDVEAFGLLVARYERTLLSYALTKLRNIHSAEDVVQATVLLAFRRLGSLREPARFGSWLFKIARTQVTETLRAGHLLATVSIDSSDIQDVSLTDAQWWIENECLLSLIGQLSEDEQLLIGMRYFDGLSMSEIAVRCDRPIGSVTKQLSRAIARLRSLVQMESRR